MSGERLDSASDEAERQGSDGAERASSGGAGRISANRGRFFDPRPLREADLAGAGRISAKGWRFFDPPRDWRGVIEPLVLEQHGVITTRQLIDIGVASASISRYVRAGRLHRIHHGVYALTPRELLKLNGLRMAAVLACGDGAALSHRSAGALLDLIRAEAGPFHVTVPTHAGRPQRKRPGLAVHRSTTLRPDMDITTVDGIPCTTPARTLLDLAEHEPARRIERALDQAEALQILDIEAIQEQISHNHGRPRAACRLQQTLDIHIPGTTATWNDLEELFLTLVREVGLPRPEVQPYLDLQDGEPHIQPDFLWRQQRVIVETDGWQRHGTRGAFEKDRRRDQRAAAAGFTPLRVTWRQLRTEPRRVQRTVAAAVVDRSWETVAEAA